VLLSPHSAAYTEGGELRQGVAWATRSVLTALAGKIPDNVYNKEVIPRWKERFGGASLSNRTGSDRAGPLPPPGHGPSFAP
jgi:hypothetical protein